MTTVRQLIKEDDNLALYWGIFNQLADVGQASAYMGICGGVVEGIYQWAQHYVDDIDESENDKYVGFTVTLERGYAGERQYQLYIPQWVMNIETENWMKAKNLFNKYLVFHKRVEMV